MLKRERLSKNMFQKEGQGDGIYYRNIDHRYKNVVDIYFYSKEIIK